MPRTHRRRVVLSAMILPGKADKFFGRIDGWTVPKKKRFDMALKGGVIVISAENLPDGRFLFGFRGNTLQTAWIS